MRKRLLPVALLLISLLAPASCRSGRGPSDAMTAKYYGAMTVRGKVIRAYPYRGQLIGNVGGRDGLRHGDVLLLMREGAVINHVLVEDVQNGTFYGSTMDTSPEAPQAREGDTVVRDPRIYEPKEPVEAE